MAGDSDDGGIFGDVAENDGSGADAAVFAYDDVT